MSVKVILHVYTVHVYMYMYMFLWCRYYYCVRSSSAATEGTPRLRLETGAIYTVLLTEIEEEDEEVHFMSVYLHMLYVYICMYICWISLGNWHE